MGYHVMVMVSSCPLGSIILLPVPGTSTAVRVRVQRARGDNAGGDDY